MELTIEKMRAVCVAHYVERRNSPEHAEVIVGNKEEQIRHIFDCIQKERAFMEQQIYCTDE